jgi:rubrerythrin
VRKLDRRHDAASKALGRLRDGTPYFAPLGEIPYDPDEDRVQCHLCGEWFRTIGGAHMIRRHGWTLARYRDAFALLKGDPTCARGTSRKLREHTAARLRAGDLAPGTGYQKSPGSGGRGVRRSHSLAARAPELVRSFHPELNGTLDPYRIGGRSGRKLWWRCAECGHVWRAAPHERSSGGGCPRCAQQKRNASNRRVARERSLAVRRPDLVAELHPSLNGELDAGALGAGSGQSVFWLCRQCGHAWRAAVCDRARGRGCPSCARRRVAAAASARNRRVPPDRSLALKRPDLARELHPTRNRDLDPVSLAAYSNQAVWWLCPTCANEWQRAPNARRAAGSCPACRDT